MALPFLPAPTRAGEPGLDALAVSAYVGVSRACVDDAIPPAFCGTIESATSPSVAIGDIDSDGDRDVVLTRVLARAETCLNDGNGTFTCAPFLAATGDHRIVTLGDFNRDGRMDAILGVSILADPEVLAQICFNLGGALLVCATLDAVDFDHSDVDAGDVDGDGAPDLVTSGLSRLCLNDGAGVFTSCSDLGEPGVVDLAAALGDLDGDGHLDIAFATNAATPDRVCLGSGTGLFACEALTGQLAHQSVDIGDVDGDGAPDLVFTGETGDLCPGLGDGSFPACLPLAPEAGEALGVSVADLDGDGRAEMAFAKQPSGEPNQICRFLGYGPPPGGEPLLDCQPLDPAIGAASLDVALWTPWIFQDGFESGDTSRWSNTHQ